MIGILLVGHGSRRSSANDEVVALANLIEGLLQVGGETSHRVEAAFLELAQPSISQGLDSLVDAKVSSIKVLPYFLTQGRHVAEDIPAIVDQYRSDLESSAEIEIELLDYLGASPRLASIILDLVSG